MLHLIYVPLVIVAGFVAGWIYGARAMRDEVERLRAQAQEAERAEAARRLERAAPAAPTEA